MGYRNFITGMVIAASLATLGCASKKQSEQFPPETLRQSYSQPIIPAKINLESITTIEGTIQGVDTGSIVYGDFFGSVSYAMHHNYKLVSVKSPERAGEFVLVYPYDNMAIHPGNARIMYYPIEGYLTKRQFFDTFHNPEHHKAEHQNVEDASMPIIVEGVITPNGVKHF